MSKSRVKYLGAALFAIAGLMPPVCAEAAPITSDSLVVRDGAGGIFVSATQPEAGEDSSTIIVVPIGIDPTQFGNATNLTELTPPDSGFSDIFGICTCGPGGALALGFSSDTETQRVNFGTFPRTFPEGSGSFDATLYLDPGLQAAGYTATFTSDAAGVPEPGTLALFCAGLAGFAAFRRRKAKA